METYDDRYCQAIICKCVLTKSIICVLYRPPECPIGSFKSCLDFIDQYIAEHRDDYQLSFMGDFNLPLINWSTHTVFSGGTASSKETASLLLDFMAENLCSQYVSSPTRLNNVLDLCISNSEELVTHISTSDTILSDHRLVEIFWSFNPLSQASRSSPEFKEKSFKNLDFFKADFGKINEEILAVDWDSLWEISDQENFPELFTQTVLDICDKYCPRKIPPKCKQSSLVRIPSRNKRKIQDKLKLAESSSHCPKAHLKSLRNKLAMAHMDIRDAINKTLQYREEQAAAKVKENPKYFYSYAKKFSKKKSNISMLFDEDQNVCSDPKKIADLLQNQFLSVFSDPSKTNMEAASFTSPDITNPFSDDLLEFSISDVIEAIDEIKPNASSGPDELPVILLKNCKATLAIPIHLIWSKSLACGHVPSFYKYSIVSPLHKKDSKALPSNYRPISLTSHIIKVFERIMRKKLVAHLETNNLLCSKQHGFRSGRSCLTQLLHHFDDVLESLMSNADFDSIYLDYAKAFDKVDHRLLIKKLRLYGINETIVKWIESFLSDRKQAVVVDGQLSFLALIISGVPQGTVLGPILFLIFINDIEHCITNSIIRCFADDTRVSIAVSCEQDVSALQDDLINVIQWSERNNMALHKDKFEYMCHRHNGRNPLVELPFVSELYQYSVSETLSLAPVGQLRDLGVLVSDDLSWTPHIKAIANKARQKAAWVLSVFQTRSPVIMLTLYKSMVRSLVEYCCPLWNPLGIGDIQELESVQKAFTARINGMRDLHYWDRLQRLSLMSLQRRRERYVLLHMWKILNKRTSNDIGVQFVSRPRLGNLATIPSACKHSSSANQSLYDSSFSVIGPKLWNAMPYYLNSISDQEQFKSQLTQFLLSLPDTPPIRGFKPQNSNSLLCWRNDRDVSSLWGGHTM